MIISIIAGVGKNNELGKDNKLLWHLSADLKHFKEITSGHPVIMGRKTFESIGKALPDRKNIVITRDKKFKAKDVEVVHSLEEAFTLCKGGNKEVFIIGGADIYNQAMEFAQKLYMTEIDAEDGHADTFFPEIIPIVFGETKRKSHPADEKNKYAYDFVEYERFF